MTPAAPAAGAPAPDWIVLKFGGTSVSRRHRWDTIGRLMKRRAEEEGAKVLVVVSAVSGVTNELQAVCDGHADAAGTAARIDALVARHRDFCRDELGLDPDAVLGERLAALRALAGGPRRAAGERRAQRAHAGSSTRTAAGSARTTTGTSAIGSPSA